MRDFDFNKIDDFDDHISKSIPNYDILIDSIKSMSEYFYVKNAKIYDLGCSTGKLLQSLPSEYDKIGYDYSNLLPIISSYKAFADKLHFLHVDLNEPFEIKKACIVYSIFTMQFLDPTKRCNYLKTIYEGLIDGGCLFIAEKIYQSDGKAQEIFSFSHYDYKLKTFKAEDILTKERDLRFNMKPLDDKGLESILRESGFKIVTPFWQMFNFKGYIAIK
jgi:tRNA (cmo5U34)-methyltransferase